MSKEPKLLTLEELDLSIFNQIGIFMRNECTTKELGDFMKSLVSEQKIAHADHVIGEREPSTGLNGNLNIEKYRQARNQLRAEMRNRNHI